MDDDDLGILPKLKRSERTGVMLTQDLIEEVRTLVFSGANDDKISTELAIPFSTAQVVRRKFCGSGVREVKQDHYDRRIAELRREKEFSDDEY